MKVWKSVGAVAVYSKTRVAALVIAALVVVAGAGFIGGLAVEGTDAESSPSPPAPVATTPDDPPSSYTRADSKRTPATGRRAAYRRGYRAGSRQLFGPGGPLRAGSAYFVRAERGPDGVRIGRRERIEAGVTYWLCSGGQRLCMRPGQ